MRYNSSSSTQKRPSGERGFSLLVLGISMMVIIPVVGLAIDSALCYVVKAKLSAACDAASLAAARNLNVGMSMSAQQASAVSRGTSFYYANFPTGFMFSTLNPPTVDVPINSAGNVITVTTSGSATVHTIFMGWFGYNNMTVNGTGTATRRDVNVVMVLDRSGSMNTSHTLPGGGSETSCQTMVKSAVTFLDKFVEGRDHIGVITFGSTWYNAFPLGLNFKSSSPSAYDQVNAITCGDNTSTALAYWNAYQQLVTLNHPSALNVILLFTDGLPNGISGYFPTREDLGGVSGPYGQTVVQRYGYQNSSPPTGCTSYGATCVMPVETTCHGNATSPYDGSIPANSTIVGTAAQWAPSGSLQNTGQSVGLFALTRSSMSGGEPWVSVTGCGKLGADGARQDIAYIPDSDFNGNKTLGYTPQYIDENDPRNAPNPVNSHGSNLFTTTGAYLQPTYNSKTGQQIGTHWRIDSPRAIVFASSNALDHAAIRVRADSTLRPVTYVIGLGEPGDPEPPDDLLMSRVANVPGTLAYQHDLIRPDGMYIKADPNSLADAFMKIAAEVLRISK